MEQTLEEFSLKYPPKYDSPHWQARIKSREEKEEGGKSKTTYESGKVVIHFPNQVRKEAYPDGYSIVYFPNKDVKQKNPDGKVVYYFAEVDTTQTTMPDGTAVYKFSNDQIEKHYKDGHKEIL